MKDRDLIDIRRLDLTVLLVFAELVRRRKTTDVAARMGLSQSAISHALSRLRVVFADPLFTRRSDGLDPTPRALELAPRIEGVIEVLRAAISEGGTFDAGGAQRLFRLAANDHVMSLLTTALTGRLAAAAPGCRATWQFGGGADRFEALRRNTIDLAIGRVFRLPEGIVAEPLFEESFAVVARKGHPALGQGLTLEIYCALDHVLVSFRGNVRGSVDMALQRIGRERRVRTSVPLFSTSLAIIAASDCIATVPARLAARLGPFFDLDSFAPPMPIDNYTVSLLRHQRTVGDHGLDWLIGCIRESL
ncbi:LysR family transcriptional regulator [Phreatobacter stygius]|uniref:LysR family transcriptional regulator n=1 Tax=Phreatobacter stygius TaxID=1940610 RepID=A0A4D7B7K5_9HYPH|nr:LysR family transcriptional regulator [Phreatobacter stygius]QCI66863.1 LysR family transcriptional regulator [Phreatobacter stygius]